MVAVEPSVTVMVLIAVAAWPVEKVWLAAEAIVAAPMAMVLSSSSAVVAEAPPTSISRLSALEVALKLVKLSPETVNESPTANALVTSITRVCPESS